MYWILAFLLIQAGIVQAKDRYLAIADDGRQTFSGSSILASDNISKPEIEFPVVTSPVNFSSLRNAPDVCPTENRIAGFVAFAQVSSRCDRNRHNTSSKDYLLHIYPSHNFW